METIGLSSLAPVFKARNWAKRKKLAKSGKRTMPNAAYPTHCHWQSGVECLEKLNNNASPANLEQIQADIAASIPRCPSHSSDTN